MVQRDPAIHMINYFGDAIPVLSNGMANLVDVFGFKRWSKVLEAIISSKAECIALIWCIVVDNYLNEDDSTCLNLKVENHSQHLALQSGQLVLEDSDQQLELELELWSNVRRAGQQRNHVNFVLQIVRVQR